jgi:hypothetical protein
VVDHVPRRVVRVLSRVGRDGAAGLGRDSALAEPCRRVAEDVVGGAGDIAVGIVLVPGLGIQAGGA